MSTLRYRAVAFCAVLLALLAVFYYSGDSDATRLQGEWQISATEKDGVEQPGGDRVSIDGDEISLKDSTGKPTGKLYHEVVRLWDTIKFTSASGKRLARLYRREA